MSGESEPDFDRVRLLLRHLGNPKAQRALLMVFTSGTPWHCVHTTLDLDQNGDGDINADDALDAACSAVRSASESLHRIRKQCRRKSASARETLEMIALLDHTIRQCTIAQRVLVEIAEQNDKNPRRMARRTRP